MSYIVHENSAEFFDNFKKFISDNNIVGTCAGVIMALATKDLILALVSGVITPLLVMGFLKLNVKWITSLFSSYGKPVFLLSDLFKQSVTWIITMIVTFIFIKTTFEYLLGVSLEKKTDKEKSKK